jgi:hypothetical protein
MYITKHRLCFKSVFLRAPVDYTIPPHILPCSYSVQIIIRFEDIITKVEKRSIAKIFPTALAIEDAHKTYVFASLMHQDETWKLLEDLRSFA